MVVNPGKLRGFRTQLRTIAKTQIARQGYTSLSFIRENSDLSEFWLERSE
jgi:hypothetical protein